MLYKAGMTHTILYTNPLSRASHSQSTRLSLKGAPCRKKQTIITLTTSIQPHCSHKKPTTQSGGPLPPLLLLLLRIHDHPPSFTQ